MPVEGPRQRLRKAAIEGNVTVIKRLMQKTSLQNPDPENGCTTLMYAVHHGHYDAAEFLLTNGHEDYELSMDFENNTVLMIVAQRDHMDIMKLYASNFPESIHMQNKQGQTALIFACKHGHVEAIDYLLECDADINQTDFDGNTALHYAAAWDRFQVVKLLIERGCQFAVKNNAGWTALDYSYSSELENYLQECARIKFEETKFTRKRNHLKVTVDSFNDSSPLTIRSATFPPVRLSVDDDDLLSDDGFSDIRYNGHFTTNGHNLVKRKESLP